MIIFLETMTVVAMIGIALMFISPFVLYLYARKLEKMRNKNDIHFFRW